MCVSSGTDIDSTTLALPDGDCDKNSRPEEVEPCPNLPACGSNSEIPFIYSENMKTTSYNITSSDQDGITIIDSITSEKPDILEFNNIEKSVKNFLYIAKPKWSPCQLGKKSRITCRSIPRGCKLERKPVTFKDFHLGKWILGMNSWH